MRIELINLDSSTDRLSRFREVNPHISNFRRFSAINGSTLDRQKLAADGLISEDLSYSDGALGCAMSHIALWSDAVKSGEAITIVEDDAIIGRNFLDHLSSCLARDDDWDIMVWGYHTHFFLWIDFIPGMIGGEVRWEGVDYGRVLKSFAEEKYNLALFKLLNCFGTPCYTISPRGARSLLDHCLPLKTCLVPLERFRIVNQNEGIDSLMNGWYPAAKAYVSVPPIVLPDYNLKSTIR
ncbi:glycosyltransferase family 25 protein [Methylobacterium sp. A49B]